MRGLMFVGRLGKGMQVFSSLSLGFPAAGVSPWWSQPSPCGSRNLPTPQRGSGFWAPAALPLPLTFCPTPGRPLPVKEFLTRQNTLPAALCLGPSSTPKASEGNSLL